MDRPLASQPPASWLPASRLPAFRLLAPRLLAGALALGLVAAACGTPGAAPTSTTAAPSTTAAKSATTDAAPRVRRRQLARREARRLFATVRLPAGAVASSRLPAGANRVLAQPGSRPGTPDLVDLHRYFIVPGQPSAVLAYLEDHPPRGAKEDGTGSYGVKGVTIETGVGFAVTHVPRALETADLEAEVVALPKDRTALRVDSQVTWLPLKDADDYVPADVTSVTAIAADAADLGFGPGTPIVPPITVDRRTVVERLRSDVDHLPVASPGIMSCPAEFGPPLWLRFLAHGHEVALVSVDATGCGSVEVAVDGHRGVPLTGGYGLAPEIEKLTGLQPPPAH